MALTVLDLNPLDSPDVAGNTEQRCYHCKSRLFTALREAVQTLSAEHGRHFHLCDGTNASDTHLYRPGLRALEELGILSPLAQSGLAKEDIRACAAASGMDAPHQQARPCLLTRYAYGLCPSLASLVALGQAEENIGQILALHAGRLTEGALPPDFRLRLVGVLPQEKKGQGAGCGEHVAPHPFVPELHVAVELPEHVADELAAAVVAAGFVAPQVRVQPALSGYYDALAEKDGVRLSL